MSRNTAGKQRELVSSDRERHRHQADEAARTGDGAQLAPPAHTLEAVVAVLDEPHHQQVEALWAELRQEFDVAEVYMTPIPHFSYHVAEAYDGEALNEVLSDCARQWAPFTIRTAGLGIFTGTQPVLYVPVVRDANLTALHADLVERLQPIARQPVCHYLPRNWLPHITLTLGNIGQATLSAIVAFLHARSFDWHIPINHLTAICDNCGVYGVSGQYTLKGNKGE